MNLLSTTKINSSNRLSSRHLIILFLISLYIANEEEGGQEYSDNTENNNIHLQKEQQKCKFSLKSLIEQCLHETNNTEISTLITRILNYSKETRQKFIEKFEFVTCPDDLFDFFDGIRHSVSNKSSQQNDSINDTTGNNSNNNAAEASGNTRNNIHSHDGDEHQMAEEDDAFIHAEEGDEFENSEDGRIVGETHQTTHKRKQKRIIPLKSEMGVFVKKSILQFDLMGFESISKLFDEYKKLVNGITVTQNVDSDEGNIIVNMKDSYHVTKLTELSVYGTDDIHRFLDNVAEAIQDNKPLPFSEDELHKKLLRISESLGHESKVFYVQYLLARSKDNYELALENLYRYFDYILLKGERSKYHYALLNLGTLHFRFNHFQEAESVLLEAINVARMNRDEDCLQYAISWLKRIDDDSSEFGFAFKSSFSKQDPKSLTYLDSLNYLFEAQNSLKNGAHPNLVLNALHTSSAMNEHYDLDYVQGAFCLVEGLVQSSQGNLYEAISTLERELKDGTVKGSIEDKALAYGLLAQMKYTSGNAKDALGMLDQVIEQESKYGCLVLHPLFKARHEIAMKMAINKMDLEYAGLQLSKLYSLNSKDKEFEFELIYLTCSLDWKRGQIKKSLDTLENLVTVLNINEPKGKGFFVIKVLLMLIEIYMQLDDPTKSLIHALYAVSLSEKYHAPLLLTRSQIHLGQVLLSLNLRDLAESILESAMTNLCDEDLVNVGLFWKIYGLCFVEKDMMKSVQCYECALNAYERMEMVIEQKDLLERLLTLLSNACLSDETNDDGMTMKSNYDSLMKKSEQYARKWRMISM